MNNVIDKLIYNTLAAHHGVNLPEMGSFRVEKTPARMEGDRLVPPVVKVVYSFDRTEGAKDITTLLTEANGGDRSAAEAMFEAWKEHKGRREVLAIRDVGDVVGGKFEPYSTFEALLNPHKDRKAPAHKRKRRSGWGWTVALPALLGIAVGVGAYLFIENSGMAADDEPEAPEIEAVVIAESAAPVPTETAETAETAEAAPTPTAEAAIEQSLKDNAPATASDGRISAATIAPAKPVKPVKPAAENAASGGPRYYVVAGVFSTEENADRCVAKITGELLNVAPEKIPYAGGKILVSLYSTTDAEEATDKMRLWRSWNESLWVYKR